MSADTAKMYEIAERLGGLCDITRKLGVRHSIDSMLREKEFIFTPEWVRKQKGIVFLKDENLNMVAVSDGYCKYFGVSRDEYETKADAAIHSLSDANSYRRNDKACLHNETGYAFLESWTNNNGGRESGLVFKCFQLRAGQREIRGIIPKELIGLKDDREIN